MKTRNAIIKYVVSRFFKKKLKFIRRVSFFSSRRRMVFSSKRAYSQNLRTLKQFVHRLVPIA